MLESTALCGAPAVRSGRVHRKHFRFAAVTHALVGAVAHIRVCIVVGCFIGTAAGGTDSLVFAVSIVCITVEIMALGLLITAKGASSFVAAGIFIFPGSGKRMIRGLRNRTDCASPNMTAAAVLLPIILKTRIVGFCFFATCYATNPLVLTSFLSPRTPIVFCMCRWCRAGIIVFRCQCRRHQAHDHDQR